MNLSGQLQQDIQRYYLQLLKGCGKETTCNNAYCCANPNFSRKYEVSEAAVESFRLAQLSKGENKCRQDEFIDRKLFSKMLSEKGNLTELCHLLERVFSNPEKLNISFLTDVDGRSSFLDIDFQGLKDAYEAIKSEPPLQSIIQKGCEHISGHVSRSAKYFTSKTSLRQIIYLIKSPYFSGVTFANTLKGMASLSNDMKSLLMQWFETFSEADFRNFLIQLQGYLSEQLILNSVSAILTLENESIQSIVKVMDSLNNVNDVHKLIPYQEFYNDLVKENLTQFEFIRQDFGRWKNQSFSFCGHPFLLDPAMKAEILRIESKINQMRNTFSFSNFFLRPPFLAIRVRREHLIEDSLNQLSIYDSEDLKKELRVLFEGEEAIDEGGVQKEWLMLIVREIFDPKYGMFIYNEETQTFWFNSNSRDFEEYKLIGKILGLAIYNGVILDIRFPHVIYKKLMGKKPSFEDLEETHPSLAIGFQKLLNFEGNVEETYGHTFQITYESFGENKTYNLKENGENIPLTNENRDEYIRLHTKYLLEDSVRDQFNSFLSGFKIVCESDGLRLFRWEELELLICGSPTLDFEALKAATLYDNGYSQNHPVIKNFWEVVSELPLDLKKKLLVFTTGSDRAPIEGLGKLRFIVTRHGPDTDRLPSAHTCYNILLLPEYSSKQKLRERLITALSLSTEGFGML